MIDRRRDDDGAARAAPRGALLPARALHARAIAARRSAKDLVATAAAVDRSGSRATRAARLRRGRDGEASEREGSTRGARPGRRARAAEAELAAARFAGDVAAEDAPAGSPAERLSADRSAALGNIAARPGGG